MIDQILYWNDVALEANRQSHTDGIDKGANGPTLSSRALAIIHLAMYDAFVGTNVTTLTHYLTTLAPAIAGASSDAAIAAAAHATLSKLYPSQKAIFDVKHAASGISGAGIDTGHAYGLTVAKAILDDRKNDPTDSDDGYASSISRGTHRADPDNDQGYNAPFYGSGSKCFAVTARFELDPPPAVGTPEYLRALKQVRGKGIAQELAGTLPASYDKRTTDETLAGIFWAYDGAVGLGTPPRLYNQIVRAVAIAKGNTVEQNAKLFALVNTAMADAGILAWDQKYKHNFWRPVLGIREHDTSMGPTGISNDTINTECDTQWLPLGAPKTNETGKKNFTPPFPAYPSGHATFGAASLHITRLFYGTHVGDINADTHFAGLSLISEECNGINRDNKGTKRAKHVRKFTNGLAQMIEENGFSRVYLGVHWFFDAFALKPNGRPDLSQNIGGVALGLRIAEDIFSTGLSKSTVQPRP